MNTTALAWDDAAHGWDQHSALIGQWLHAATTDMLDAADIVPGAKVLDLAAGAGDQTRAIAHRVGPHGEVLATDISPGILDLAVRNLRAAGYHQVRALTADMQALDLNGAQFDAAVCRLGLMFCHDPLRALQAVHAALAPSARFSGLVFSAPAANPCITITMQTAQRHAGAGAADPFAPGALLSLGRPGLLPALLQDAGFECIDVQPIAVPFHTPRVEDYVAFVRSAGSPVRELLKPLDTAMREHAWADITQQLNQFSTPHGWAGPNELLLFSAAKP
jgi:ubiquinone/menaquinone biosynthesis C-methylase UbiE